MILSLAVHIVVFVMGSAISPLFPTMRFSPPVIVELTDAPVSELPRNFRRLPSDRVVGPSRLYPRVFRQTGLDPSRPKQPPSQGDGSRNSTRGSQMCPRRLLPAGGEGGGDPGASLDQRGARKAGISLPPSPREVRGPRKHLENWRPACAGPAGPV